ncbi:mannitol 1-phosphate dehydrogenase [Lindgomyces ingoldianus]|uniref:Mannitol 1-phosphate dehydrogenase n=1 Tax=Lindgomyces ingoldianus TaxID=673940 RepID=A0ACB6Q7M9_9PLEO|nr:mannitol 1-phosphate dehydrogenase [Lindgomyces ingoldianus]KAF2462859.1 mannitol 1-phosphate dehydrogenase [Lindgomyces ingoldianus]
MPPSATTSENAGTFQNHASQEIAIVGGGLGGLALAIGLLKHHVNVHIYESAAAFSETGAGVAFGPNSTRALGLIHDALLEGYKKHATFNENRDHDHTFLSFRWGMDEKKEGGNKAGDLMWHLEDLWNTEGAQKLDVRTRSCIHRARLLDELVALLPQGITSFRKNFVSAEEQLDGSVKLYFADGTTALASAVIGCDGIKSQAREIVCGPSVQATYVGEYAYRAMVPKADAEKALGKELARNGQLYCGYGAYVVTYPVEHGDFTNMVAIPRESGESYSWSLADWTVPTTRDEFVQHFKGWYPPLVEVIAKYCGPQKWALFNLQHSAPYYKGKICLLGDSAHATTPHLGAGAGMAMEDAFILSSLIASVKSSEGIESAFRAFDSVRRPRTQQLIKNSRIAGLATDFMMPGVEDDTDRMKDHFKAWYKWLWHEDLEAQLQLAKNLLKVRDDAITDRLASI